MIDLHIHTTSSDGSDEPKDILIKAQQSCLKYISITDHDSMVAYKKLGKIKPAVKIGESIREAKIPYEILEPWLPSIIL